MARQRGIGDYTISAADLWQNVDEWELDSKVQLSYVVGRARGVKGGAYVEAVVSRTGSINGQGELLRVRQPLDSTKPERWPSAFVHATWRAMEEYRRNGWLWSVEEVRKMTTE